MTARIAIVVAALAAASCVNKPSGFGIDVEARTSMLQSSTRNSIVTARLLVTGAETFMRDIPNVAKAAQSGAMKFRYVPGVHAGAVTIRVEGLDGSGAVAAAGISQPITVVDGKSVDAVFFLATNGNGVACMAMSDCISNNCVDGVCCESACDGVCETCNLPGQAGVCNPQMQGTDPDNDCAPKIPPVDVDGGTDTDGGATSGTTVDINLQACGGTCNGMRACTFPGSSTSCGTPYCPTVSTVGSFFCDGNGDCNESDSMCVDFACNSGACKTSCTMDADCLPTDFCNLNINKCVPKHTLGQTCSGADQCSSGFCATGVCCDSACNDPSGVQSCNNTGNLGHCQCTGVTCDPGVSCVLWYKDSDGDLFGDSGGTIAAGTAKAGCASGTNSTPPNPFVANSKDCDDGDASANPNVPASSWFTMPSKGKGLFDYNCDGTLEKQTPENPGGQCGYCGAGLPLCNFTTTCATGGTQAYFGCFYNFVLRHCVAGAQTEIVVSGLPNNDCGQTEPTVTCGVCPANGTTPTTFGGSVVQGCH